VQGKGGKFNNKKEQGDLLFFYFSRTLEKYYLSSNENDVWRNIFDFVENLDL